MACCKDSGRHRGQRAVPQDCGPYAGHMDSHPPTGPQRALLGQIVEHAGELAPTLEVHFNAARTLPDPDVDCGECFNIEVQPGVRPLPAGTKCPLCFDALNKGVLDGTLVLLWHEDGLVNGVEIAWVEDPHPALNDLLIIDDDSEHE